MYIFNMAINSLNTFSGMNSEKEQVSRSFGWENKHHKNFLKSFFFSFGNGVRTLLSQDPCSAV